MTNNALLIYWDSSAILSALFSDTHSNTAKKRADATGLHFISSLAYAEVSAVIARMKTERILG